MKFYSKTNPELFIELIMNEGDEYCGYETNIPHEDSTFLVICRENNIGYYAAPNESFYIGRALQDKRKFGYTYMIVENLS